MSEFTFEIVEKLLVLSENEKGWTKELNRGASTERQLNLICVHGVQIIQKWVKVSLYLMKNLKSF